MSGFIGIYELFLKLELALNIKLKQKDKDSIKKALYPLNKMNILNLDDKDLKEVVNKVNIEPKKQIQDFLFAYLKANLQDMI